MDAALRVVRLGHAARNLSKVKVRQPLRQITLVTNDPALPEQVADYCDIILEELNVKDVVWAEDEEDYVHYEVKPNFRTLGPRLGKLVPAAQKALARMNPTEVATLATDGKEITLELDGQKVVLAPDDLDIRIVEKEGTVAQRDGNLLLVLDLEITPELREEGLAREFVNRVQSMRKTLDLEYERRIVLEFAVEEPVRSAVLKHQNYIMSETLAVSLNENPKLKTDDDNVYDAEIEGLTVLVKLTMAPACPLFLSRSC